MAAANLYTLETLKSALAVYGVDLVASDPPVFLWKTGWGFPFTLYASEYEGTHYFDELQYQAAKAAIAKTMPANWNDTGNSVQ